MNLLHRQHDLRAPQGPQVVRDREKLKGWAEKLLQNKPDRIQGPRSLYSLWGRQEPGLSLYPGWMVSKKDQPYLGFLFLLWPAGSSEHTAGAQHPVNGCC